MEVMETETPLGLSPEQASKLLNRWRDRPQDYLGEVLGVEKIWRLQDELLSACPRAIKEHKQIYVASGHSLGKDYICAGISLQFLHCYSPSIVIQTAPTDRQVKKIMWAETLGHWKKKIIDLGGTAYANPYLEIRKEDWYLIGFTTKETGASREAAGGKFQGFHAPNICIIVTEAQAVEDTIYDQIDGIATSENVLVIFVGNPTRAKGRFAKGLKDKVNNIVFHFSCLENPNYIQRKPVIPGLASYEWVEDKRRKWGEEDPRWIGRVLGQIPGVAINTVLGANDIEHMKSRHGMIAQHSINAGVAIDPAGEGVDDNIITAGRGGEVLETRARTNMPPSIQAKDGVDLCKTINGAFVIIDCDGVGVATYQEAVKLGEVYLNGIQIIKFHGSAPSTVEVKGKLVYQNMRAEAAFVTQAKAREGKAALDWRDTELIEDLAEEEYFTNKRGLIQIEDKNDIKERLGRSPGKGDAYKMLLWALSKNYRALDSRRLEDNKLPRVAAPDNTVELVHGGRGGRFPSSRFPRQANSW